MQQARPAFGARCIPCLIIIALFGALIKRARRYLFTRKAARSHEWDIFANKTAEFDGKGAAGRAAILKY
jgi:hypothetical protein